MKANEQKRWYAIYTGYKREKFVAGLLQRKKIETYVPLLIHTRRYTRKIKEYRIPLISCYVFVYVEPSRFVEVLSTEYVHGFVRFEGKPAPIPEEEMDLLKRVVGERAVSGAFPVSELRAGAPVELISGSLTGLRGKVVEQSGKSHFIVELDSIGYALRLEVDIHRLRRVA